MAPPKWKSKIPPVGATTLEISKVARVQNTKNLYVISQDYSVSGTHSESQISNL